MTGLDPRSVGLELRLGNAGRENAPTKARRLLVEGRVVVHYCGPQGVRAFVRGSGELHRVEYQHGRGWICSCPAIGRCSHRQAVELVTQRPGTQDFEVRGAEA